MNTCLALQTLFKLHVLIRLWSNHSYHAKQEASKGNSLWWLLKYDNSYIQFFLFDFSLIWFCSWHGFTTYLQMCVCFENWWRHILCTYLKLISISKIYYWQVWRKIYNIMSSISAYQNQLLQQFLCVLHPH